MRKIAIVVEGVTELVFVHRFLERLIGAHVIRAVEWWYRVSGHWRSRTYGAGTGEGIVLQVLLISPGGDGTVRSYIQERLPGWAAAAFTAVIGLRDLYTGDRNQTVDLEWNTADDRSLSDRYHIKTRVHFAVREIEAWFLLDAMMPSRFDGRLTPEWINERFGIDLRIADVEAIQRPSLLLRKILETIGGAYDKSEDSSHAVCSRIDYEQIYLGERGRCQSIDAFLRSLDCVFVG